jgi:flagellar biosynthetic protein FliQ
MTEHELYDILHETLWTTLKIAAPPLLTSLVIGFTISLLQALTQIQEMTLSFVPKILAIFFILLLCGPFMAHSLHHLTESLYDRIIKLN